MESTANRAQTRSLDVDNRAARPSPAAALSRGGGTVQAGPRPAPVTTITLGSTLRAARLRLARTLTEVACAAGCDKSYLSRMENNRVHSVPSGDLLDRLDEALGLARGHLKTIAQWQFAPAALRAQAAALVEQQRAARQLVQALRGAGGGGGGAGGLDALHRSGQLGRLIERVEGGVSGVGEWGGGGVGNSSSEALCAPGQVRAHNANAPSRASSFPTTPLPQSPTRAASFTPSALPLALPVEVPVINRVAAGYPREFTDLGYPARVADEYVRCPDLCDPDAFAARVVGDLMHPSYLEGDIVIFSPARAVTSGMDCFARLEPDHETTFKRVFFERGARGEERIRLQPLNAAYPARVVDREQVAGLYAAVGFQRAVGVG